MSDAQTLLMQAAARLAAAGIESARREARLLLAHALEMNPDELLAGSAEVPDPDKFEDLIVRRVAREPLAYIVGTKEFWSLPFAVGPGTLIPRPETEILVEELCRRFDRNEPLAILDLGTGSGCLIISALREFPHARGFAVDRSADSLKWARKNAEILGVRSRIDFLQSDWLEEGAFDVVLSNPPYIKSTDIPGLAPEVSRFEPPGALDGGGDGLAAYRAMAPLMPSLLKAGGRLFWEIGVGQSGEVSAFLRAQDLATEAIVPDLAGIPRCIVAQRTT